MRPWLLSSTLEEHTEEVFTGFVPAQSVASVGGQKFLESLSGNPITVTGKIELYKGRRGPLQRKRSRGLLWEGGEVESRAHQTRMAVTCLYTNAAHPHCPPLAARQFP